MHSLTTFQTLILGGLILFATVVFGTIGVIIYQFEEESPEPSAADALVVSTATPLPTPRPTLLPTHTPFLVPTSEPLEISTPTSTRVVADTATPAATTKQPVSTVTPQQADSPAKNIPSSGATIIITTVNKGQEFVDIQNVSNVVIDLTGWRLLSEKGTQNCNLAGTIQPNEKLRIWALAKDNAQGGFNCGFEDNIWNNSEMDPAVIFDQNGVEIYRINCIDRVC